MISLFGFAGRMTAGLGCLLLATLPLRAQPDHPAGAETAAADARHAIQRMLRQQVTAWNQGNLEQFMEHYWRSDELTFSAGGAVTRGWQATLDRYRERYPDRSAMGQLAFDGLEVRLLGPRTALVLGNWQLQRRTGSLGGNFSLVVQQRKGRWVIVHDHTSVRDQGEDVDATTRD